MNSSTPEAGTSRSAGRYIAIVAGSILAALAVTFVTLGGALVGMHSTKRDGDGYYATGQKTLATPTHALVADKLDANGPAWLFRKSRLGTIRVEATGTAAKPVFVGVARVTWPVKKGNWAVVIMNADGTAGIETPVSVGAKAGFLVWLGAGLLGLGALFAAGAAACYFTGRKPKPRAAAADTGAAQLVTQ
jgi:hypothetical protein